MTCSLIVLLRFLRQTLALISLRSQGHKRGEADGLTPHSFSSNAIMLTFTEARVTIKVNSQVMLQD